MFSKYNVHISAIVIISLLRGFCCSIPQIAAPPIKSATNTLLGVDSNSSILPFYDLIVAVPITNGEPGQTQEEVARTRAIYGRYVGGEIVQIGSKTPLTFKLVFIANTTGLPVGTHLSRGGLLVDDFFYVNIPWSNAYDGEMTKAMVALLDHLNCGLVYPKGHRLHNPEFEEVTEDALKCHPVFHQGAFYVLGKDLVRYLNHSRDLLTAMTAADAMVGSWLLGIEKVVVDLPGMLHFCPCDYKHLNFMFFDGCASKRQVDTCIGKLGEC